MSALDIARGVVVGAHASSCASIRSSPRAAKAAELAGTYVERRGWDGSEHAARGMALIRDARADLVVQPVVNRPPRDLARWLGTGGELSKNSNDLGGTFRRPDAVTRLDAYRAPAAGASAHWASLQFLPAGPLDDALLALRRPTLGQAQFGGGAALLDPDVLRHGVVLREPWLKDAPPASIEDLDAVLLDRHLLQRTASSRSEDLPRAVDRLERMGPAGIRKWLTSGEATAADPRSAAMMAYTGVEPMEVILPSVQPTALTGVRLEPNAFADPAVRDVYRAAGELGLPISDAKGGSWPLADAYRAVRGWLRRGGD